MRLLLAAAAALLTLPAQAQLAQLGTFSGTLAGADAYDRPVSPTGTVGSDFSEPPTNFQPFPFTVSESGNYQVALTEEQSLGTLILLYEGAFDPDSPLSGVQALNNTCSDQPQFTTSLPCASVSGDDNFNTDGPLSLTSGTPYVLVVSEFFADNPDGTFSGVVLGPEGASVDFGGSVDTGVDLTVTPLVTSIPTTGGKARFRTTVSNDTDSRIDGAVVVMVNGVERRRLTSALTTGGSQRFTLNLSFPARVPDGVYSVTLMAEADGATLDTAGPFDVVVGEVPRSANPALAGFDTRAAAADKELRAQREAYLAERRAAAEMVGVSTGVQRARPTVVTPEAVTE